MKLSKKTKKWFQECFRYVNYLGAAMLYLRSNPLLREPLAREHIKDRILGHWGTVPGLNFIYLHLNYLISLRKANVLLVVGPGHGAPAGLANLFLEGTLGKFYPQYTLDDAGTVRLFRDFSWPSGFASHFTPHVPGSILEGGELGYSLSTAFGAAFDNPDLIVACVIGDGEAETGPLAAAWQSNKFLNPATSGAVLPILHINGYKISCPTVYGTMSGEEIKNVFTGYGYEVMFADTSHERMAEVLERAYGKIRKIQIAARSGGNIEKPKWPLIVLRTPKGWTGVRDFGGKKVEGSYRSHGIPLGDPKENQESLEALRKWLASYRAHELVDKSGAPKKNLFTFIPKGKFRMGVNRRAYGGNLRKNLKLPELTDYAAAAEIRGKGELCNTAVSAMYIRDIFKLNKNQSNFRFFCPDETESNKYGAVFEATKRGYLWPLQKQDENLSKDGRVMEILSEHTLQGWLQGYLLTGRHGLLVTYEAFAEINASMVDQYAKFIKQASGIKWRPPVSSLNYILSSVGWRQEHNGYSHQNPSFVSGLLEKHGGFVSAYFPADANTLLAVLEDCFRRKNAVNAIVAGKQSLPQWVSIEEARRQVRAGLAVWDWIDAAAAKNPDVVLASAGDYPTLEAMAALSILKKKAPYIKIRYVNVCELTALGVGDERNPLQAGRLGFEHYFTKNRPVVFNFHGYPDTIKKLIYDHRLTQYFSIHGYEEEGATTTPFDMQVVNKTSRYHLCMDLVAQAAKRNREAAKNSRQLLRYFKEKLEEHRRYIVRHGKDLPEIEEWRWQR